MSGFLTPDARLRELNDLGLIQAGARSCTRTCRHAVTPLATYSDVGLTVPNANPDRGVELAACSGRSTSRPASPTSTC
jgi:hypothetical protein